MSLTLSPQQTPLEADAHGVLRVTGTRVTLDVVVSEFNQGASAEEIALAYPSLKLADVYAALSYYLHHQDEVDAYLSEQDALAAQARERHGVGAASQQLREKLLARQNSGLRG